MRRLLPLLLAVVLGCELPAVQNIANAGVTVSTTQEVNVDVRFFGLIPLSFGSPDGIRFYGVREGQLRLGVPLSECQPGPCT